MIPHRVYHSIIMPFAWSGLLHPPPVHCNCEHATAIIITWLFLHWGGFYYYFRVIMQITVLLCTRTSWLLSETRNGVSLYILKIQGLNNMECLWKST